MSPEREYRIDQIALNGLTSTALRFPLLEHSTLSLTCVVRHRFVALTSSSLFILFSSVFSLGIWFQAKDWRFQLCLFSFSTSNSILRFFQCNLDFDIVKRTRRKTFLFTSSWHYKLQVTFLFCEVTTKKGFSSERNHAKVKIRNFHFYVASIHLQIFHSLLIISGLSSNGDTINNANANNKFYPNSEADNELENLYKYYKSTGQVN